VSLIFPENADMVENFNVTRKMGNLQNKKKIRLLPLLLRNTLPHEI